MSHRRRPRRLVALAAALVIVAAQSASLAYGCTLAAAATPATVAGLPCHEQEPAGDGGPPAAVDNLCEVHCQAASPPSPGHVVMAPPPAFALAVAAPPALDPGEPAAAPGARSVGPPPRTRYCRLQL